MGDPFSGVHWMLATPFLEDEQVDTESIPRLVEEARETGCRGVVALGEAGEAHQLTDKERSLVAETVMETAKDLSVTLGATSASTQIAIARSREAKSLGAVAVMIAAPRMRKDNPEAVFVHYQRIAEAVDLPIIVQDFPLASGMSMSLDFIVRVAETIPSVHYLKLEDAPTPNKISAIRERLGDKLPIFGGLGGMYLLDELDRGTIGAMTGLAYPEILVDICRHMSEGNRKKAAEVYYRYLPFIMMENRDGGSGIRKEGLFHRGLITTPTVRRPGAGVNEATRKELHDILAMLGL